MLATACLHVASCVALVFVVRFSLRRLVFVVVVVTSLLVGLTFSGIHHGLILLFLFLGMCWLGLHVHSDNSAVGAMLSG